MMRKLQLWLQTTRPVFLLSAGLIYLMGVGIARYLALPINTIVLVLGLFWLISLFIGMFFLDRWFEGVNVVPPAESELTLPTALWTAGGSLLVNAASIVVLEQQGALRPIVWLALILGYVFALMYAAPPLRLSAGPLRDLILMLLLTILTPAWAFWLQTGETHRLLAMASFPLAFLYLAQRLAFEFSTYAADLAQLRQTILIRIGWENGLLLHNLSLLAGYLVMGVSLALGFPASLAVPAFLPLALGIFQIWYLGRIADGMPPRWGAVRAVGLGIFLLTAYLLTFGFWTR